MKKRYSFLIVFIIFVASFLIYDYTISDKNKLPLVSITSPKNKSVINQGNQLIISVDANAPNGTIEEVRFFIDDIGKTSVKNFPYNYLLNTKELSLGSHQIKVTAIDNNTAKRSKTINFSIVNNTINTPPIADFKAKMSGLTGIVDVQFTDLSKNSPNRWEWDFGDHNTSNEQNPVYTYTEPGSYTIKLTVSNSYGGNSETKENYIITSAPQPVFSYFTDPRDNQVYKTVQLENQTWFAENLNYKTSSDSWDYNNLESNGNIYGRLYLWETACNICPRGWRLPFDDEWGLLISGLGGINIAGGKLKEIEHTHWFNPNEGATNSTGFTALPGGNCFYQEFSQKGEYAYFWTATKYGSQDAMHYRLDYDNKGVYHSHSIITRGMSIRCIKNQ